MKYCGHCGTKNDDNAKFCGSCGAAMTPTPTIPSDSQRSLPFGQATQAASLPKLSNVKNPRLLIVAAIAVVAIVFLFASCSTSKLTGTYVCTDTGGNAAVGIGSATITFGSDGTAHFSDSNTGIEFEGPYSGFFGTYSFEPEEVSGYGYDSALIASSQMNVKFEIRPENNGNTIKVKFSSTDLSGSAKTGDDTLDSYMDSYMDSRLDFHAEMTFSKNA